MFDVLCLQSGMTTGRWNHDMYQGQGGSAGRMAPQVMGPVKLNISNLDYGVTDSDIRVSRDFGAQLFLLLSVLWEWVWFLIFC